MVGPAQEFQPGEGEDEAEDDGEAEEEGGDLAPPSVSAGRPSEVREDREGQEEEEGRAQRLLEEVEALAETWVSIEA